VNFGIGSQQQIQQQAHIPIVANELYNHDSRTPVQFGMLDRRMVTDYFKINDIALKSFNTFFFFFQGINVEGPLCTTCGKGLQNCLGHFGYIDLQLPVFHVGFFKATITALQTICKTCSHVLLDKKMRKIYRAKLRTHNLPYLQKKALRKQIVEKCKKVTRCPNCNDINGTVKKCGMLKISHEKFENFKRDSSTIQKQLVAYDTAVQFNKEIEPMLSSALINILNPLEVFGLLKRIPDEDVQYILMNPEHGHPKDMILTRVPVPPVCIRPAISSKSGTIEDDLTRKLREIVNLNELVTMKLINGESCSSLMETFDDLQLQCALYINGELPGIPPNLQPKTPSRGLVQRLKGKEGRFRKNLSGKAVDFCARTVISPDPNLRIDEVGVPELIAKLLTYPTIVNEANIEIMRKLIRNGPDIHPGAIFLKEKDSKLPIFLKYGNRRETLARNLKVNYCFKKYMLNRMTNELTTFSYRSAIWLKGI
jgi:DNA-directed RNA polymerase III subunit RPC1